MQSTRRPVTELVLRLHCLHGIDTLSGHKQHSVHGMADQGMVERAYGWCRAEGARGFGRALIRRLAAVRHAVGRQALGTAPQVPIPMDSVLAWLSNREAFTVVQIGAYVGYPRPTLYTSSCRARCQGTPSE